MKLASHDLAVASHRFRLMLTLGFLLPMGLGEAASTNGILPYSVRVWQTDDGLPQNSVHAIAQTADGYLWVGTREGLARFDGVRFRLVEDKAAPELKHGWITALCATREGSLWIACEGVGLTRWKDGAWSHFTEADGVPGNQPRCLLEARDGSLWIGGEGGGLARYRDGKFTRITQTQGLADNIVRSICEDHQGNIRVATRRGLSKVSPDGAVGGTLNFGADYTANSLRFVCEDRHGHLWVGSTEGLYCQDGEKRTFYGIGEGLPDHTINALYEDSAGQLWIGTYLGLARMRDEKLISRPSSEAVFGDLVWAIFEDREGNLWVGAQDGLYRLNPARFTTYTTDEGLTRNNVMSVCEDRSGTVWMGIWGGGLNAIRGDKITAYLSTNALRDSVLSLHERRDGTLWLGLEFPPGGVERIKDGLRSALPRQSGFINAAVRAIQEDRQGTVWVGTRAGLNAYRGSTCEAFTTNNGLAGDEVLALCEDAEGNLWIGTEAGLSRRSGGKFTNFTTRDGLSHNSVDALYEDQDHTLWIGTKGGGLNRFKAGKFTAYTTRQGLFSDEVYEILEDDYGYFWLSCRRGIFRVARRELDELDRGSIRALACTVFGKADGLASVQCNGVAKPAGWKGKDGRLWFPTIRGVVAVETSVKLNDKVPPVLIEEVIADRKILAGSEWPVTGEESLDTRHPSPVTLHPSLVTIPPGRGELEVHFTALSFQAPEKNRFKYLLEGLDSGWSGPGPERTAHYQKLAPGSYRFRVLACNNDGVWNETGAALSVVLLPHYWQTWWFKAAILATLGLVLTLLYRVRVARLRELERLRIEIAANLHDDVGARLTKVAMITELVERETGLTDRIKPHIEAVSRTTREIIQAMDEIVWTINPKNDTLDHLANYIFQYAQEYFQNTGVRCRLDVPAQLPDRAVSTEARHNLFMIVKEALNNVLKHAAATEVRVGLAMADSRMTITIADNGRGFSPAQARAEGNGLQNMKQRMKRIGGRLDLESKPGAGTTIKLEADAG
ncbi:MAG TPA: two-component regulator propeller domain-containing protein [Candidatus Binatia bacterium]|jgi:ligand-binding sensor domain-containing protein/signal transduction histidine kinase|nr:two-component regulator propeller domain-containing protein [Candidatus Binatia bacterium]